MQKGDVVGGRLVPTDQSPPEAVQPTVSAFHHPAAGFEAGLLFDGLGLFASAADVRRKTELSRVRRTSAKSSPLSRLRPWGCSGLGAGRGTGRLSTVARTSFMSWRLAPANASPTGMPPVSVNRLRLTPRLPHSPTGMWPTCRRRSGADVGRRRRRPVSPAGTPPS